MDYSEEYLLRRQDVEKITKISRSEIYRRLNMGDFPAPVHIGTRCVRWRYSDVQRWIATISGDNAVKKP